MKQKASKNETSHTNTTRENRGESQLHNNEIIILIVKNSLQTRPPGVAPLSFVSIPFAPPDRFRPSLRRRRPPLQSLQNPKMTEKYKILKGTTPSQIRESML